MATLVQGLTLLTVGSSIVYWMGTPCVFHGYVSGTDCSLVMCPDKRAMDVVLTSNLTTTATG